jgi:hypothetical protein
MTAPELREQADEVEREYAVTVDTRFGYLCARVPGVSGAHWDADNGDSLRRQLDAARVPRRTVPSGQGARS